MSDPNLSSDRPTIGDRYSLRVGAAAPPEPPAPGSWAAVPWRTIIGAVAVIVATIVLIQFVLATARILTLVAIAGFFALVLAPVVTRVERRVGHRRTVATGVVVFSTLVVMIGLVALFVMPVRTQLVAIITDLPGTVHDAAQGRGPVGNLVERLNIEGFVRDNEAELARAADRLNDSSWDTAQTVIGALVAFITITLLTFLFLTQSTAMSKAAINMVPARRRSSVRKMAVEAAGAVSGYVIGNLLISLIAGVTAFILLVSIGVPSPVVLALFVAFMDLIPLVGAVIGAAVCVVAAYIQSPTAGIIALVFFVVYQQVENGVLYPWVMSRKVRVNPVVVLLSVLLGAELFGLLGALLAVPLSGALQVIIKTAREERRREQLLLPDDVAPLGG